MTSLAIKVYCNSEKEKEQGGMMTADFLTKMLRNTNKTPLTHQLPLFAQEHFLSTLGKCITRGESNQEKFN